MQLFNRNLSNWTYSIKGIFWDKVYQMDHMIFWVIVLSITKACSLSLIDWICQVESLRKDSLSNVLLKVDLSLGLKLCYQIVIGFVQKERNTVLNISLFWTLFSFLVCLFLNEYWLLLLYLRAFLWSFLLILNSVWKCFGLPHKYDCLLFVFRFLLI